MHSFLLIFILQGCAFEDPKYIHFKDKPSNDYYTKEIYSKMLNHEDYSLSIFNTDLYKNIPIDDDDEKVVENFIRELSKEDYKEYEAITDKEPYDIKINFADGNKYILKIYNNTTVSVSPWDGIFHEDIINMDNVPIRYNLYDFCKHVENESKLNQ